MNTHDSQAPLWMVECYVAPDLAPLFMDVFTEWSLGTSWDSDDSGVNRLDAEVETVCIQAWFACPSAEVQQLEQEIQNRLMLVAAVAGIECPSMRFQAVPPKNWLLESYQHFPPLEVGRYYIHGSHIKPTSLPSGKIPLQVDAATAFGSGQHATTQCCLQLIDQLAQEKHFRKPLDLGCGSGILALAMAATWACEVVASDIDPEAVRVTLENAQLNNLASQLLVFAGDGASALPQSHSGPFDIIVANILVGPLCQLAPSIARLLTEDGRVVLSGILISQIPQIAQAYRVVGLHIIEEVHHQEWAAVVVAPLSAATGSENV